MSEWQEVKLGELVDIGSSKRVFYEDYVNSGIPFYRSKEVIEKHHGNDISTDLFITKEKFEQIKAKYGAPEAGDLLLTSVGTLGIPYIVEEGEEFYFKDGNLTWFKNYNTKLYNKFLYYWIMSPIGKNALDMISIGSTQAALTIQGLKNLYFYAPPIEEQKAIASVLTSLDDKIDLLHRQNITLERMAETLFRQWFVEEAQEDWQETTIAELIEFNPPRKLSKGQVAPYLDMACLDTSNFNPTGWYLREFSSGTKFISYDTLLARITPCLENGKTGYVTFLSESEVGWGSTEFIVMRPKLGIHPFFAYVLARYQDFRDYAEGCMEGSSGRQRVNVDHLKDYQIRMPSNEVIKRFNEAVSAITPKLELNAKQIQTLEKLRDNLLPKLMSGEVRVEP